MTKAMGDWEHNVKTFKKVVSREQFDLVIADEAYEIEVALEKNRIQLEAPFVMMYDFIGNNSMSWNPCDLP